MKSHLLSGLIASAIFLGPMSVHAAGAHAVSHVLLISVDGLHQNDLEWFVKSHPGSALAELARKGLIYTQAVAPFPSDSFPGMVGQVTGGNPRSTGIYYDDAYSRELLPPGTTSCTDAASGTEVRYANNIDKDRNRLDAGLNIAGLYDNIPDSFQLISALSGNTARDLIDPAHLPVDPKNCQPVYPHQYLKVNTVFEVAHARGLRTAWSDKHPAYEILSGPSGQGVDEFFTPEINSSSTNPPEPPAGPGPYFSRDNLNTQLYDGFKVTAVLNWSNGHDHAGNGDPGVPAIFGMNFQSVATAQRFNTSRYYKMDSMPMLQSGLGGYKVDTEGHLIPGPVLVNALEFVDGSIGKMVRNLDLRDNVVIISAKHGQSPENRADLTIINDDAMIDALNNAWKERMGTTTNLVAHAMDDDGVLLWLTDRSPRATGFAARFLMSYSGMGVGSDAAGNEVAKPFSNAGLRKIYAGAEAAAFMGVAPDDTRVPDVIGIAKHGSVYGDGKLLKIVEHGGYASDDRHVALLVAGKGIRHKTVTTPVQTTQIAPTILKLLDLDPNELQAVRSEGTTILPGL